MDPRVLAGHALLLRRQDLLQLSRAAGGVDTAIRDSYGRNHARLTRIKAAYDPDNLFLVNENIKPAS